MQELITQSKQLPDNLEDLAKFALIGREKLVTVRAEIRAIDKIELAREVRDQKLQEGQEIGEAVLDAEVKIGELTKEMEKSVGGRPSKTNPTDGESFQTKAEQLKELGITHAERFETLANHPKVVEQAKADARAEGRIVTRSDVLNRIAPPKSTRQTMREFKKEAREQHKDFQQAAKEGIVNFKDIKADKENVEVIVLDTQTTIRKAFAGIGNLGFMKESEIKLMAEKLTPTGRQDLLQLGYQCSKTIAHIMKLIGG